MRSPFSVTGTFFLSVSSLLTAATTTAAPIGGTDPATLPAISLEQDYATTVDLTLSNSGDEALDYSIRIQERSPAATTSTPGPLPTITGNETDPTTDPDLAPEAVYIGEHLNFGISNYGEIMPFQYPIGTEHLRYGTYHSGYTVYYRTGSTNHIAWASYRSRNGIVPVSYEELENSADRVRVRVTTRNANNTLRIERTFDFRRDEKHVNISTEITNVRGFGIADVIFKEHADWDVDGNSGGDTFNYDEDYNLAYAHQTRYVGLAADRRPDFRDLDGWNDYSRRLTDQNRIIGPVTFDGLVLLHFEFGRVEGGDSVVLQTAYGAGDTLEELQSEIGFSGWLTAMPEEGSVPATDSELITLTYDAAGLAPGVYNTNVFISSNDPATPIITLPAQLTVTPDVTPPATIGDLAVAEIASGSVRLEWTSVGDNGLGGPAAAGYDIRYSTEPITEDNWDDATQVTGEPLPGLPGAPQSILIDGLDPSTPYYFAIRVSDDAALSSGLAGITATTRAGAALVVTPTTMPHQTLEQDSLGSSTLTLSNTGDETMDFTIDIESVSSPSGDPSYPDADVPVLEFAKDETDWRAGEPVTSGAGGPDTYGYRWRDSDEPGGPAFNWIDISSTGTSVGGFTDDSYRGPFPIGFDFDFYGETQTQFWIQSNGMINFDPRYISYTNQPIPRADGRNNMIAWMWDDLYPYSGYDIRYQVVDGNKLVISYLNYARIGSSGRFDAQIILYRNGDIKVQYGEFRGSTPLTSATVGIENQDGTDGLQVVFNSSYIHEDLALLFKSTPDWLSAATSVGTILPGESQDVTINYNGTDQDVGEYAGNIVVSAGGITGSPATVPASLSVTPDATPPGEVDDLAASDITFESLQLSWTAVADNGVVGKAAAGYDIRYLDAPIDDANWDSATQLLGEPFPADPGSAESMSVTGLPPSAGLYIAMRVGDDVGLWSGISNIATVTMLDPPVAGIDPSEIDAELPEGQTTTETVTISNTGPYPLDYEISATDLSLAPIDTEPTPSPVWDLEATISSMETEAYVPGELIVRFVPGTTYSARASAAGAIADSVEDTVPELDLEVWQLPEGTDMETALRALADDPNVQLAEPNYVLTIDALTDDPRLNDLWGMHNLGQTGGTPDADIDAPEAWDTFTGSDAVVVAVIDTGIDYNHPDLAANMWVNEDEIPANGIDDDGNGYVDDIYGYDFAYNDSNPFDGHYHGTHVAGTVGAVGNNAVGVVGVVHEVQLMAVKFLNDGGSGSTADAISSVIYAVNNGAQILNNSWGGGSFSAALQDAIEYANENDVLFVASAGNDGRDTDARAKYPATYPNDNIMSVAATDHRDLRAGFSNWGLTTVDIAAPGVGTISTAPGNSYRSLNGTSMAAPHVSGAAALLKGYNPSLTALEIKAILMESADPIAAMAGRSVSGGRLNASVALDLAGPDWISLEGDLRGTLAAGETASVDVLLDSTDKELGLHLASLALVSNDPFNPTLTVPVQLNVLPDCCPPAQISDLTITEIGWGTLEISWTAVGDDGVTGTADAYDLRISNAPITEANWADATPVDGEPGPSVAGTPETMVIRDLNPATPYWIAIRARDNADQVSALSNVANAVTVVPPTILTNPDSMPHVVLAPGGDTATRTLTLSNIGDEDLIFSLRVNAAGTPASPPDLSDPDIDERITDNDTGPSDPAIGPTATYTGTHLQFGISNYGEVMPFQYPVGTEHLRRGAYRSGYTVSYRTGSTTRVKYAGFDARSGILPVSYEELENNADRVVVRVVTRTDDNFLLIDRLFEFDRDSKHFNISTRVTNNRTHGIADVIYKEFADWDMNGGVGSNYFLYDEEVNLAMAWQTQYAGIASDRAPDYRDLRGWNDFNRKDTDEEHPTGPVRLDGLTLLHFELGRLEEGMADEVGTAYVAGDSMEDLREEIDFSRWLTADATAGTIEPGGTQDIELSYDSGELDFGRYMAAITIDSNDPLNPSAIVPASMTVNSPPVADAGIFYYAKEGSVMTFDGRGSSDADFDILEYRWDFTSDGQWDTAWSDFPKVNFAFGIDYAGTVTLQVRDPYGETATDTAPFSITNVAPTPDSIVVYLFEGMTIPLTLTGYDPGWWEPHTYTVMSGPGHGTLTGTPPSLSYTPDPGYDGMDSFTWRMSDGVDESEIAEVTIHVLPLGP